MSIGVKALKSILRLYYHQGFRGGAQDPAGVCGTGKVLLWFRVGMHIFGSHSTRTQELF